MEIYEYRVVPLAILGIAKMPEECAKKLYETIMQQQAQGFEFVRVEHVGYAEPQGCLGMSGTIRREVDLVVFRSRRG